MKAHFRSFPTNLRDIFPGHTTSYRFQRILYIPNFIKNTTIFKTATLFCHYFPMQFQGRQSCYYTRSFSLLASCLFASCTVIYMKICSPHENISAITCLIRTSFFTHGRVLSVSINSKKIIKRPMLNEFMQSRNFDLKFGGFHKNELRLRAVCRHKSRRSLRYQQIVA